jgi:hypothetical protein
MTSYWGPLGWMTLHSASMLYSENPDHSEQLLMHHFIELFAETISCYHCKTHFIDMKRKYAIWKPNYLSSKRECMLFIFRCHNAVNKRIDKPILRTVEECITTLKNADSYSSLQSIRDNYLLYLQQNWGKEFTGEAFALRKKVQELIKINNEYFNLRTIDWTYTFEDSVLPINESLPPIQARRRIGGFKNGRLITY